MDCESVTLVSLEEPAAHGPRAARPAPQLSFTAASSTSLSRCALWLDRRWPHLRRRRLLGSSCARHVGVDVTHAQGLYLYPTLRNDEIPDRGQDPSPRTPDLYPAHLATLVEARRGARASCHGRVPKSAIYLLDQKQRKRLQRPPSHNYLPAPLARPARDRSPDFPPPCA